MTDKRQRTNTPGIFKRGGRYVVVYRYQGRQHKAFAPNMAAAKLIRAQNVADISRGEFTPANRQPFGEYARAWIESYRGRSTKGFRESTRVGYRRSMIDKAIPYFDERGLALGQIEPQHIKAFIGWLLDEKAQGKRLSLSTVRGHVAAVRVLFATAVEEGALRANPCYSVRITSAEAIVPDPEKARRPLEVDELRRFLEAVDPDWTLFFELLAHSGLRIGEATELRWKDIAFGDRPTVKVRRNFYEGVVGPPKTSYGVRNIPLSRGLAQRLWGAQGAQDALVFTTPMGERARDYWINRNVLKPATQAAGVPWATCHTFRHTCASILFANGKSPKQVQEWLGHHDPAYTLKTYIHLMGDGLGDADFLDDLIPTPERATPGATNGSKTGVDRLRAVST
ncbi:MAG: tyrosine-type recombinase/integrase [Solirubrobacteraceae bacterium]